MSVDRGAWRRRMASITLAAAALLTASLGAAPAAGAAPDPGGGGPVSVPPRAAGVNPLGGVGPTRITLLTGDIVTYRRDATGHVSATLAPRPGREMVTYQAVQERGDYFLIPDDVRGHIDAGVLDRQLFNLDYLVANGYTDDRTEQLPLIVQFRQPVAANVLDQQARTLPARASSVSLAAVNGAAVKVDKKQIGKFWAGVFGPVDSRPAQPGAFRAPTAAGKLELGVRKVWLDAKVKAVDETSNTQIGAPTAWAAGFDGTGVDVGIIDTGIDASHPDLAGKVVAARNFVEAGQPGGGDPVDVTDRHGHGTHVASIVAGDGDASGGRHKGVAPAGRLIVAKALGDDGSGSWSAVIEAMQWQAATQHARIVSMSLGGDPTDGTDPVSEAVNTLTTQYGTLFVIAAGNSGADGAQTISAPGAATAALTVGAVDSADKLATFSSRGPRLGDFAVKPEITAPGVQTIAARAAGTSMGTPVDQYYTAASGTSMATPHVAGAAAILLQQHPDWTADQIKNALIGAARGGGYTAYEQGAGRLDVARAVTQQVTHDTPSISTVRDTVTRRVTYRNFGAEPVTLALSVNLARSDGTPAGSGTVHLSSESITVPAAGTSYVDVTVNPAAADPGTYTGRLLATGSGGVQLVVPIAARNGAPHRTLRVRVDADAFPVQVPGNGALGPASAVLLNDTDPALRDEESSYVTATWTEVTDRIYEAVLSVPAAGSYGIQATFNWNDTKLADSDGWGRHYHLIRPQIRVDGETTVTFDLERDVVPITAKTPRPSEPVFMNLMYTRSTASGNIWYSAHLLSYPTVAGGTVYVTPTDSPTIGSMQYMVDETRIAPQVSLTLYGDRPIELHPRYDSEWNDIVKFTADRRVQVATEDDLQAGRDVRGKLVLTNQWANWHGGWDAAMKFKALIEQAAQRGAAGILTDSLFVTVYPEQDKIPVLHIDKTEAALARATVSANARPWAAVRAQPTMPYEYKLVRYLRDNRIPTTMTFSPTEKELAAIETTYHGQHEQVRLAWGVGPDGNEASHTFAPGKYLSILGSHGLISRTSRIEYYTVTGPDILWSRDYVFSTADGSGGRVTSTSRAFTAATSEREDWNGALLPKQSTPGPDMPTTYNVPFLCEGCRQGDRLRLRPGVALGLGYADAGDASHQVELANIEEESHLFHGDTELRPQVDAYGLPYYPVPAATGSYRFTTVIRDRGTMPHPGMTVATTWTFRSGRPDTGDVAAPYVCVDAVLFGDTSPCAAQPLINLRYQLGLAPDTSASAGRPYSFTVTGQQGLATTATPLAGMRVWFSGDGGEHWVQAKVTPGPGSAFRVHLTNPSLADSPTDTVSLKVEAWDGAGNSVEQIITDAYILVAPPHPMAVAGDIRFE